MAHPHKSWIGRPGVAALGFWVDESTDFGGFASHVRHGGRDRRGFTARDALRTTQFCVVLSGKTAGSSVAGDVGADGGQLLDKALVATVDVLCTEHLGLPLGPETSNDERGPRSDVGGAHRGA